MRDIVVALVACELTVLAGHVLQGSSASAGSQTDRAADVAAIEKLWPQDHAATVSREPTAHLEEGSCALPAGLFRLASQGGRLPARPEEERGVGRELAPKVHDLADVLRGREKSASGMPPRLDRLSDGRSTASWASSPGRPTVSTWQRLATMESFGCGPAIWRLSCCASSYSATAPGSRSMPPVATTIRTKGRSAACTACAVSPPSRLQS